MKKSTFRKGLCIQHYARAVAPAHSSPDSDEVDLWTVALEVTSTELECARAVLSDAERKRFERVVRSPQRERLILARAALRRVLSGYLEVNPSELVFTRGRRGKPALAGNGGLAFSLSHSGALVVVAVTSRPIVGVDIELLGRPVREGVMRRALAPGELARVTALEGASREEAFLRYWTAKEAYAKAVGTGLSIGMAGVVIVDAAGHPALEDPEARARFTLQRFDPRPDAVGVVAAAGGPWRARRHTLA